MKMKSNMKAVLLLLGGVITVLSLMQCKKTGDVISGLDRSLKGVPDSAVFASYYDTTIISTSDATPDVNDVIKVRGVQTIIREYCGTSNCHAGPINPKIFTYDDIMRYITAGNPEGSELWEFITTNDFNKAMPPVASNHEMSTTDKTIIYNWIRNGAKKTPDLKDFRPAAIRLIVDGCGSINCHSEKTAVGAWARRGLINGLTSGDTVQISYSKPGNGDLFLYCLLTKPVIQDSMWAKYKDSVSRFYTDTVANASFRPFKTFSAPWVIPSTPGNHGPMPGIRGPLDNYANIIFDVLYPKSARSNSSIQYIDGSGNKYYVRGNNLNVTSSLVSRIDSTLLLANPSTGLYATAHQGDMAYADGGLKPSEIALIKAWYFADPNIPTVWKYGTANAGILKYRKTGKIIKQ